MAEGLSLEFDINADPAYRKLAELRKAIEATRKEFAKDVKSPAAGGLDAKAFEQKYGVIKARRAKFLKDLEDLDKSYAAKQSGMAAKSTVTGLYNTQQAQAKELVKAQKEAAKASRELTAPMGEIGEYDFSNIVRLRYALYDVASSAQAAATAFNAFNVATLGAAIDYETAFTPVERATQIDISTAEGRAEVDALRESLLKLSTELPQSFQDISGIAALGSALGIANENLVGFTETVVKFSAASNVGIEASAQAFGTLGELLNVSADEYENLGSAIAFVGVNSNATESQIVAVAEAIAGVATTSGLSADFTVGLAGALASLKVPAEQSRGALTRVFAEVNRAAAEGGPAIERFANIIGTTAEEAQQLASSDTEQFFTRFVRGLSGLDSIQLTSTLDQLNLADIRVTNTLQRLSGNLDTTSDSLQMANDAYASGTFLADSYAKKQDDVAVRFQELQNSIANLLAILGGGALEPVGFLIDALKGAVNGLTEFVNTPIGAAIGKLAVGFGLITGAVLTLIAGVVPIVAGFLALRTAVEEASGSNNKFIQGTLNMLGSFNLLSTSTDKARISLLGFKAATNETNIATLRSTATSRQVTAVRNLEQAKVAQLAVTYGTLGQRVAATGSVMRAQVGVIGANIAAMSTLQKVIGATSWIGLIVTGIGLVIELINQVPEKQKTAFEEALGSAEEFFGKTDQLARAMATDAGAENAPMLTVGLSEGYEEAIGKTKEAQREQSNWTASVNETKDAVDAVGDSIDVAFGANAKKALLELISGSEDFQEILKSGVIESLGGTQTNFLTAILGDPVNGAKRYVDGLVSGINAELTASGSSFDTDALVKMFTSGQAIQVGAATAFLADATGRTREEASALLQDLSALEPAYAALSGEIQRSAAETEALRAAQQAYVDATGDASAILDEYRDRLSKVSDAGKALEELGQAVAENGTAFADATGNVQTFTAEGIANTQALINAVEKSVAAAQSLGLGAVDGVAAVFAQLRAQGVETALILQQLSNIGFGQFNSGFALAASGQYKGLSDSFNAVSASAKKAGSSIGGTSAKVRTLIDYANDLKNVWSRAFDIRFGAQSALDKITSSFQEAAERIEDARISVRDFNAQIQELNASIQDLTADRALQEYFLSVAEAYGDTLKAQEIRANLAEIDAELVDRNNDLVDANKDLARAQSRTNRTLVGSSDAAIDNRAEILGLVGEYQSYIQSLASSGMSQDQLAATTSQLRQDFINQATQLGYNQDELGLYAVAFDDVSTAIGRVPRNVTVRADVDPALQALNELNTRANAASASRTLSVGTSIDYAGLAKFSRGIELATKLANLQTQFASASGPQRVVLIYSMSRLQQLLASGNFASGGYVSGPGGPTSDSIPANLSNGEYVVQASAVSRYGVGFFDRLNQMQSPSYFSGSSPQAAGMSVVSLSPEDRALLRNVGGTGEVVLYADNQAIARSANAGNKAIVAAGGRP